MDNEVSGCNINLQESIKSSSLVADSWLILDISAIKNKTITEVRESPELRY